MNFLFKIRVFLWTIVSELEYILYPYKTTDPQMDHFYMVKNSETGERYSIMEWIKHFDERLDSMEDNFCYVSGEIRKLNKLDGDLLELKNKIYRNKEKN